MFQYIINRLTERSTWLGLIALASSCGATIATELTEPIITIGVALAGLVGIVTKDKGSANSPASTDRKEDTPNG